MIKKKYPGATIGEIGKKAGEMWKALEDKSVSIGVWGYGEWKYEGLRVGGWNYGSACMSFT